jgi:hypothetical protein
MTPSYAPGQYVLFFECPKCKETFSAFDEADAEALALAEAMAHTKAFPM